MNTKKKKGPTMKVVVGIALLLVVVAGGIAVLKQQQPPAGEQSTAPMKIPVAKSESTAMPIPKMPPAAQKADVASTTATVSREAVDTEQTSGKEKETAALKPKAADATTDTAPAKKPIASTSEKPENRDAAVKAPVESAPVSVAPSNVENQKTVRKTASANTGSRSKMEPHVFAGVSFSKDGGGIRMIVRSKDSIQAYHYFILSGPPRLVVDLEGRWAKPDAWNQPVDNEMVKSVRLWKYEDKLRLVCDLRSDRKLIPDVQPAPEGLVVRMVYE